MEHSSGDYEDLKSENASLRQELDTLKLELDNANQQLYEYQRNVKVLTSVQAEYQNEIDMLQSEKLQQKQKYQDIIKQLEQNINNMRDTYNDEKQTFENVITKMNEKNELMKNELDVLKGSYDNDVTNFGDTSSLIQDILSEPPEFYENQQLKDTIKDLQKKNENLTTQLEEYRSELENLKESFECTRADLQEANNNNQFLNDEILCLKSELDTLKNQPLNKDSRGNSLFAEVDDRRVYLQDKMNKMKENYVAMTQEKAQFQNLIHQLKLENVRLMEKWKSDIEEKEDDDHEVTVALRSRIDDLEKLIETYKKELLAKPVIISKRNFEEIEFYSLTITEKNKEIQSLRDQISAKSLDRFLLSTALRESNEEKRKWKLEAMTKQQKLELIEREMADSTNRNTLNKDSRQEVKKTVDKDLNNVCRSSRTLSQERLSDIQEECNTLKDNSNLTENSTKSRFTLSVLDEDVELEEINKTSTKSSPNMLKEINESTCDNKENVSTKNNTKKVSFAESTVTSRKTELKGGRRIVATNTIHFKD